MKMTSKLRSIFLPESPETLEHAYLNRAVSMADLERRMREIDSGRFRGRR
ncbi:DUF3563 family protein [Jiella marina]|nr:DUF3563 family protein [Jiella sp. LLJ827]MCQ0989530.1 DUF3563 domain-containing protein [Jiella sp. LLJ827]